MKRIVLLRHGESLWNKEKTVLLDGRDVDLSEKGVEEACKVTMHYGRLDFLEAAYTYLKRAVKR